MAGCCRTHIVRGHSSSILDQEQNSPQIVSPCLQANAQIELDNVPQPGSVNLVDPIGARLMNSKTVMIVGSGTSPLFPAAGTLAGSPDGHGNDRLSGDPRNFYGPQKRYFPERRLPPLSRRGQR